MIDPAYCADGCGRLAETERPQVREMTPEESARHAERLIRMAIADDDHAGVYLHEALIMLRCFTADGREQVCSDHATLEDR